MWTELGKSGAKKRKTGYSCAVLGSDFQVIMKNDGGGKKIAQKKRHGGRCCKRNWRKPRRGR